MRNFKQHIIRKGERIICWFSCGAASALATKMTIEVFGLDHPVLPVYCDTSKSEHPDNERFIDDCEKWFGTAITRISNSNYKTGTVEEVFEKHRYMAGIAGARCTTELKKLPRHEFATPDDIHVFGFTADEERRISSFELRNPELNLLWVLRDHGQTKQSCYEALMQAGIELPDMYRLGFDNNNCPGCVKATSPWYWQNVRKHFPDVFKRRCEQSRSLGVRLVQMKGQRIFLDELPDQEFKKYGKKENLSCGPECGGNS